MHRLSIMRFPCPVSPVILKNSLNPVLYVCFHVLLILVTCIPSATFSSQSRIQKTQKFRTPISQNHRIPEWVRLKGSLRLPIPDSPAMMGTPFTRPGCAKAHSTHLWTLLGTGHLQLLWATSSSASLQLSFSLFSCHYMPL